MKGMLKAEFFKFKHSYALWIILGVISASCMVSVLTGTYSSAEQTLVSISMDNMVPILACVIYGAIILTEDFSSGILRHYIVNGYKRSSIVFAKFIHYIAGSSILLFLYPAICVLSAAAVQGIETSFMAVIDKTLLSFIQSLPLYWGIFGLFFLISILIQKGVFAMSVSLALSIIVVVFTNKFYESLTGILKYSPIIQISEIAHGTITSAYFISVSFSFVILAVCVLLSVVKFNRIEF